MNDLIKALTILSKYLFDPNTLFPTYCEQNALYVQADYTKIPDIEIADLKRLGFFPNKDCGNMISHRFGSC